MPCSSPWDGGLIMTQCHPDPLCYQLSSPSWVTFTHIVPWLTRSKFISLILHQRTSAYLLHEKPFSTCEMKLKTTSWEVYMRNEICIISYWEQSRSGLRSSQSCRENECKALYLLAIPETWLHIKDYISALFLRQETKTQTLSQKQVWLRVSSLEEHGGRAEVVISCSCVVPARRGGAMIASFQSISASAIITSSLYSLSSLLQLWLKPQVMLLYFLLPLDGECKAISSLISSLR